MSEHQRPVGPSVGDWTAPPLPVGQRLQGRYARLDKLHPDTHAAVLYKAFDGHDWVWDYMWSGPFASSAQFHRYLRAETAQDDMVFHAIYDQQAQAFGGVAAYLRMKPASGAIEVGSIAMAPCLQRTRAATEAMYLMMKWAFEAGYRRYEWKCDALNHPSRRAAQRLGFSYEGIFRQATVVKGRNRDTAWFSVIDTEWPALSEAFQFWLSPSNFEADGTQRERLSDLTALVRAGHDPSL
ncbi:MAG: GNAT family N-acetyltransferase [Roseovarius sp.]